MYFNNIIWLLAWPVMIILSYYLVILALKTMKNQIERLPDEE